MRAVVISTLIVVLSPLAVAGAPAAQPSSRSHKPRVEPCTAKVLRKATHSVMGPFHLRKIVCKGTFAKAEVQLASGPEAATALYHRKKNGRWTMLDVGSGLECPEPPLPIKLCKKWLGP